VAEHGTGSPIDPGRKMASRREVPDQSQLISEKEAVQVRGATLLVRRNRYPSQIGVVSATRALVALAAAGFGSIFEGVETIAQKDRPAIN
jgi:hypothetical protein